MENEQGIAEFIVTARKWRPQTFKDVVGQEHITQTLLNAIRNNRIHHAYLFSGPRGVGKTTTARILARALNCLDPQGNEPCNNCASCLPVLEGRSLDVIEIDGASNNSVDDIRKLRENAKYPPASGKYKMYIIDEVHMLSTSAFNALLKTLEEPPPHLMFVFATTESHKLPATILSRCQRFEFHRMEIGKIVNQLKMIAEKEGIGIDDESLVTIAKKADGSMRDSQSIFDQVVAFCGKNIVYGEMADALHLIDIDFYFRISTAALEKDTKEMFAIAHDVIVKGYDYQECLGGLLDHLRNLLTVKVTGKTDLIESSASFLNKYKQDAEKMSKANLLRMINLISSTEQNLKYAPQPRIRFEIALVQLASMDNSVEISTLLNEIRELKKKPLADNSSPKESVTNIQNSNKPGITPSSKADDAGSFILDASLMMDSRKKEEPQAPAPEPIREKASVTVSGGMLHSKWKPFLEKFAKAENDLFLLKQESNVKADFFNNEVVLKASSDFFKSSLEQKKVKISQYLNEFYGAVIKLKIISEPFAFTYEPEIENVANDNDNNSNNSFGTENDSNSSNQILELSDEKMHPVEKALIDAFNPKEINYK